MKETTDRLKRDIGVHKDIEKELAKRAHFCQKVIKRLKAQAAHLENQKKAGDRDMQAMKPENGAA